MSDIIKGLIPAVSGSAVAFLLSSDQLNQRIGRFILGVPIGFYGGPVAGSWLNLTESVAMFFVGAFGLLILSKIHDGILAIDAAAVSAAIVDRFRKLLGL